MSDKKTLAEWEKIKGFIVEGVDPDKELTEEELDAIEFEQKTGVNHEARIEFLQNNGFEVTRENMIDSRLSAGHLISINGEFIDYDEYKASETA